MKIQVITFANRKGGSGKTSLTLNCGAVLGKKGYKVLLIDLDPQAHLSFWAGVNTYTSYPNIYDVLLDRISINKAIFTPSNALFEIIPSTPLFNDELLKNILDFRDFEKQLLSKIFYLKRKYDFILIDTPPTSLLFTYNAFIASEGVIIPVTFDFLSVEGLTQLVQNVYQVNLKYNPNVKIIGIAPNRVNLRSKHARRILEELSENFGEEQILPFIRKSIKIPESVENRVPLISYAPHSKIARDFFRLVDKLLVKLQSSS